MKRTFARPSRAFVVFLAVLSLLLLYSWLVEPNWIDVTRHEVRFKNLPEEFNGLVVAHLSDLHMKKYGLREREVIGRLKDEKPGLIAVTGDFTLEGSSPDPVREFLKDLRDLKPPFGVWAVLGNHDHWNPLAPTEPGVRQFFSDAGIGLLVNEWGRIGKGLDTLTLVGVDDPFTGHANLGEALRGTQRTPFAVLLAHSPEIFMKADLTKFDLVLAGHTHGGQVRLPLLGALWLPAGSDGYDAGWFHGSYSQMYVSRGLGTSILPFRFLCSPEIAVITLKRRA